MSGYTFKTLNDRDFELLTQDLLQAEFQITLEGFKRGKDQGIDLRYARNSNNLIIQCKHYYDTGRDKLISDLTKKDGEFEKAKKLNSTRYVLVTSVEFSPQKKDDVLQKSNGLIKDKPDIIGNEDLNTFLRKFPEIEKKHYKLWLSSTNILEKIFHDKVYQIFNNPIIESSKNKVIEIRNLLPKLVRTEQYKEAYKKLVDNHIIFITGEAGCGKSTISELLFIDLIQQEYQGWFSNNLTEFKGVLNTSENINQKEVYFWDDIFGHTYFESERSFDSELIQFIQSIQNSRNKYLIINSRTAILNSARIESEKIKREKCFDINQYELKINKYSDKEKAVILYNHCILNLEDRYFDEIKKDEFYFKIINHRNFSPRLIEFITDQNRFSYLIIEQKDYSKWILKNLENPEEVWADYFDKLSAWAKDYLKICYSFQYKSKLAIDESFNEFLHCCNYSHETDLNRKAADELTKSFLNLSQKDGKVFYTFFNPSIEDFLTSYFNRNLGELKQILNHAIYYEQFGILDNSHLTIFRQSNTKLSLSEDLTTTCLERITQNKEKFKSNSELRDLALYKTISKLPVTNEFFLETINTLLPNIEKANESDIYSILQKITDKEIV